MNREIRIKKSSCREGLDDESEYYKKGHLKLCRFVQIELSSVAEDAGMTVGVATFATDKNTLQNYYDMGINMSASGTEWQRAEVKKNLGFFLDLYQKL